MSIACLMRAAAKMAAVALFITATASAQSPAVDPQEAAQAKTQVQQQAAQPLNNQPVWKEIRSGEPQVTTIRGRETNILIQSQGQTWRSLRNSDISVYGGWLLVALVLVIGTFFTMKGTLQMHAAPTGRKVMRFTGLDRAIHWTTAISFCVLAISGLIILFGKTVLLPLIGYTLFSWLAILAKNLHNFIGPLFIVCTVVIFINFVRDNFPGRGDLQWMLKFGGMFGGEEPPSGKFNAGEKLWFWGGVTVLGIVVGVAGAVLDFPNFDQTRQTMQIAHVVHSVGAILFMLGAMGHIYMGTIGMAGAYDAMRTGYVDEAWAKEHHAYWYNDIKSGKVAAPGGPAPNPAAGRHRPA